MSSAKNTVIEIEVNDLVLAAFAGVAHEDKMSLAEEIEHTLIGLVMHFQQRCAVKNPIYYGDHLPMSNPISRDNPYKGAMDGIDEKRACYESLIRVTRIHMPDGSNTDFD